jgi:hypothetical protein
MIECLYWQRGQRSDSPEPVLAVNIDTISPRHRRPCRLHHRCQLSDLPHCRRMADLGRHDPTQVCIIDDQRCTLIRTDQVYGLLDQRGDAYWSVFVNLKLPV